MDQSFSNLSGKILLEKYQGLKIKYKLVLFENWFLVFFSIEYYPRDYRGGYKNGMQPASCMCSPGCIPLNYRHTPGLRCPTCYPRRISLSPKALCCFCMAFHPQIVSAITSRIMINCVKLWLNGTFQKIIITMTPYYLLCIQMVLCIHVKILVTKFGLIFR
jgi:hypothetical protein